MVLSALGREGKIFDYFSHPIHLHGHSFYVVDVEYGAYENGVFQHNSSDTTCENSVCKWANGSGRRYQTNGRINNTAIRKDIVIVPAGGYVVIAFQADNPGYWFMHCHIEAHLLEGMTVIIQEYPDNQQPQPQPPYGINNIGNFLWPDAPKNWWMIGCIIAVAVTAVLLMILILVIILWCTCRKKKENKESSGNVENENEETSLLHNN